MVGERGKLEKVDARAYRSFVETIKSKIRAAQVKASFSVNAELILLYWDIGQSVVERQAKDGWGASVIDHISRDIQKDFPGIEGFSSSNISRMRTFYLTWNDQAEISARPVPKLGKANSAQLVPKILEILLRIPWGHNVDLLFKVKTSEHRFYCQ